MSPALCPRQTSGLEVCPRLPDGWHDHAAPKVPTVLAHGGHVHLFGRCAGDGCRWELAYAFHLDGPEAFAPDTARWLTLLPAHGADVPPWTTDVPGLDLSGFRYRLLCPRHADDELEVLRV